MATTLFPGTNSLQKISLIGFFLVLIGAFREFFTLYSYTQSHIRYIIPVYLCYFQAFHRGKCVGTVVCKMGEHRRTFRGYIAMLVVLKPYRGQGIGIFPPLYVHSDYFLLNECPWQIKFCI